MDVLERLNQGRILVADGAWGTQLDARGLPRGEPPEKWVLQRPEAVLEVGRGYAECGPDILMTVTMNGSPIALARAGLAEHVDEINRRAVELSMQAAAGRMPVFASVGPTGEFMEPLGEISEGEMVAAFAEQMAALLAAGADGIVIETMFDLGEAKAALRAANEHRAVPVVASMTFDRGKRGYATIMGVSPRQAAEELQAAGADVVGSNCGHGIEQAIEVIRLMRSATDTPLWCKPNAGIPRLQAGEAVFEETPEQMASHFEELVEAGAQVIGGCCGTTPKHIRALVRARDEMTRNQSE
ncbi:MAG: homocysteine S-methyltransferase family protein [Armatimonadota bacterium]